MPLDSVTAEYSELMLIDSFGTSTLKAFCADSLATAPHDSIEPLEFDATLDSAMAIGYDRLILTPIETVAVASRPDSWSNGLEPSPRFINPASSSIFLLILACVLIIAAFNIRNLGRILVNSATELVKVREGRDNIFMEHSAGDARTRLFMLLIFIASSGIFMAIGYLTLNPPDYGLNVPLVAKYCGLAAVYIAMLYVAYQTVGYTFAPGDGRREWVRGYTASLILSGALIALPAVIALFYPVSAIALTIFALSVVALGRMLFIIKGFRIFYEKISDLVYFILYLCTLEIIPLLVIYRLAMHELL